jgi:hypothetical protein
MYYGSENVTHIGTEILQLQKSVRHLRHHNRQQNKNKKTTTITTTPKRHLSICPAVFSNFFSSLFLTL